MKIKSHNHKSIFPIWIVSSPIGFALTLPEALIMRSVNNYKGRKLLKLKNNESEMFQLSAKVKAANYLVYENEAINKFKEDLKNGK